MYRGAVLGTGLIRHRRGSVEVSFELLIELVKMVALILVFAKVLSLLLGS